MAITMGVCLDFSLSYLQRKIKLTCKRCIESLSDYCFETEGVENEKERDIKATYTTKKKQNITQADKPNV